jgi:predicted aconitase with swiveling domain
MLVATCFGVLKDANVEQTFEVGAVVKGKVVVKPSSRGTGQGQLVGLSRRHRM